MSPSCTQNQACRLYMHIQELIKQFFNGLSTSDLYPLKHKALGWIWNSFFIYRIQILESVSLLTNLCKQKGNNLKISPSQLHRNTCREEIVLSFVFLFFFFPILLHLLLLFCLLSTQYKYCHFNLFLCPQFK